MTSKPRWFQTTAIDYPNSRPHIGTAFEKLGADVQARYRRMEGFDVFFLMGNDENTVKVSQRAAALGLDTQAYCDDMARQFRAVWDALDISYDCFIQTSSQRHKHCCRKFIQKVYDNGYIYKGSYEGWFCAGCEEFKTEKQYQDNNGLCPNHRTALVRRSEPCYFFALSKFQDRLLAHYQANPDFIQPESRRNEIVSLIENEGLRDINISRYGEEWGIPIPFDPQFTIYVWFDALLTYITGIGYGDDEATFRHYWPCDMHFIGKDITRFHCALWPAMLWAAGEEAPKKVYAHGFVYLKNEEAGTVEKISKSLGNVIEPMEVISKFSADAFRYYFLRECPFPSDGEFSWSRFTDVYNAELANNLGNLLSRCLTLITKNYGGILPQTANVQPQVAVPGLDLALFVGELREHIEACRYHLALQKIVLDFLTPTNQYLEEHAPWKLVKTDKAAAQRVLFHAVQSLRIASILLKPFIPRSAEKIYTSFNFAIPWNAVRWADAVVLQPQPEDLRITAELIDGKIPPLFPRIG
ncbi:MAG: methionine--tRNA ligase [Gemmataceae bacterium]|nr:methionine--tRNA ligase [Gemmata sp.]MDW8198791.1 methionine--tRNA ligase [Gemmataceae bacterium]